MSILNLIRNFKIGIVHYFDHLPTEVKLGVIDFERSECYDSFTKIMVD